MARNIGIIIDKVITLIPKEFKDKEILVKKLKWAKTDAAYRPPENQIQSWNTFVDILQNYLPATDLPKWAETIKDLMADKIKVEDC